ncbi:hypothetical protein HDU87_006794 [Geranomyces variabilis]|uniref:Carbohydrate kinase PfkB domain-containing protein n=1 Tax=Geranomyces variabilis TaxID=109894 RepID=A0AAD5TPT5_9FUNG|nr:hypothetical protein HDU87_006794 [Geranomyces variabilis]
MFAATLAQRRVCRRTASAAVGLRPSWYRPAADCLFPTTATIRRAHSTSKLPEIYDVHPEVARALAQNKGVVALESTIISHGMPYPQNLETALAVEEIVRQQGCVPATIAVLDGRVKVGLSPADLEKLAQTGLSAKKTSRRDLALVVSQKLVGATTVSGTMVIAHKAGIKVFVTGGIGGVHRGGETSMDVSADLTELGRTPVTVVCAGAKSILDIERTLEFLETQGVTVATYGDSPEFPAFYTPKSGHRAAANLTTPDDCAALIQANAALDLGSGMVIAVPIPVEDAPKDAARIEQVVVDAVNEAASTGVKGKDITPFLLDRVKKATGGESLTANIALVKNNARIGSRIAAALAAQSATTTTTSPTRSRPPQTAAARPLIIGGTVLDISARFTGASSATGVPTFGTSHPGPVRTTMGGVGRNVAEACHRTGGNPRFVSAVGADVAGDGLLKEMVDSGMDVSGIRRVEDVDSTVDGATKTTTAIYNAFLRSDGDLLAAVADMRIHAHIRAEDARKAIREFRPPVVAIDGNLSEECVMTVLETCAEDGIPVLFEPTSEPKAVSFFTLAPPELLAASLRYTTPNTGELTAIFATIRTRTDDLFSQIPTLTILEKRGALGVRILRDGEPVRALEPEVVRDQCVSVTGAGDSLVGAVVTGLAKWYGSRTPGKGQEEEVPSMDEMERFGRAGMRAAGAALMTEKAVCESVGPWVFDINTK